MNNLTKHSCFCKLTTPSSGVTSVQEHSKSASDDAGLTCDSFDLVTLIVTNFIYVLLVTGLMNLLNMVLHHNFLAIATNYINEKLISIPKHRSCFKALQCKSYYSKAKNHGN